MAKKACDQVLRVYRVRELYDAIGEASRRSGCLQGEVRGRCSRHVRETVGHVGCALEFKLSPNATA